LLFMAHAQQKSMLLIVDAACVTEACTKGFQWCEQSGSATLYHCDTTTGFYVEFGGGGSGDVAGPGASTDNGIPRFSGTSGKIIEDQPANASLTFSDTGILTLQRTAGAGYLKILHNAADQNGLWLESTTGASPYLSFRSDAVGAVFMESNPSGDFILFEGTSPYGYGLKVDIQTGDAPADDSVNTMHVHAPNGDFVLDSAGTTFRNASGGIAAMTDAANTFTLLQSLTGGIEIENNTAVPGSCTVGQIFMDTDATSGQQIYGCEAGTFVLQGDGGAGGGEANTLASPDLGAEVDLINSVPKTTTALNLVSLEADDFTSTANIITVDSTMTRDTEWDTLAEINAASTDTDAVLDTDIGGTVQAWDAELDTIAALAETNGGVMFVAGGVWTTDLTPAIDCTDCTNIPAGSTHTGTVTWSSTPVLESGAAFTFGDGTDATITHTVNVSTGTDPAIAYTNNSVDFSTPISATSFTADPSDTGEMRLTTVTGSDQVAIGITQVTGDSQMDFTVDDTTTGDDALYFLIDGVGEQLVVYEPLVVNHNAAGPGEISLVEDSDNGANWIKIIAPAAITSNQTCTLENDSTPFDGCITAGGTPATTKCMTIETPTDADNFLFFRVESAITVTGIDCISLVADTDITVQECDANGGTCGATEAAITCSQTNTTEATSIDDAAVDTGDWMRIDVGTIGTTPTQVNVCVTYTVD